MNIIIIILIFCTVLFLYLHIVYHLKTCDDLEIYEISNPTKERLDEICNLRQPIIFNYNIDNFSKFNQEYLTQNYSSFDIKLRTINDPSLNLNDSNLNDSNSNISIALNKGITVLTEDKKSKFISENNGDFLEETCLIKTIKQNDEYFRPILLSSCIYDYLMGSNAATTPLRYDMNYRNYFIVLNGTIKVKMTPPKNNKYLHLNNDYDNFEFRSPINPWNVQEQYKNDFNKIKFLDTTLEPGKILFIPAYWWYSFEFQDSKTSLISLKYRTYMNTIAILPHIFKSFLQKQNTRYQPSKEEIS
jgi:hypothetical protein